MPEINWFKKTKPFDLDKAVADVLAEMDNFESHSPEYARCNEQLDRLMKMRTYTKDVPSWVGPAIGAGATMMSVLTIVIFEASGHSITSSAAKIFRPKI